MKNLASLVCVFCFSFGIQSFAAINEVNAPLTAQDISNLAEKTKHVAIGWDINNIASNYGAGLEVQSPTFLSNNMFVKLSGSYNWVQGTPIGSNAETWAPYGAMRLGVFTSGFVKGTAIRGYGGGGAIMLLPSTQVSDESTRFGGFGLVGLEFFLGDQTTSPMFIELGGVGTGAGANSMVNNPLYANGFLMQWGFRYFL